MSALAVDGAVAVTVISKELPVGLISGVWGYRLVLDGRRFTALLLSEIDQPGISMKFTVKFATSFPVLFTLMVDEMGVDGSPVATSGVLISAECISSITIDAEAVAFIAIVFGNEAQSEDAMKA